MFPRSKHAAVLILLYEQNDQIFVLLTTRSKTLRSHPGQTALPGGKYDEEDGDLLKTAVCTSFTHRHNSCNVLKLDHLTAQGSSWRGFAPTRLFIHLYIVQIKAVFITAPTSCCSSCLVFIWPHTHKVTKTFIWRSGKDIQPPSGRHTRTGNLF